MGETDEFVANNSEPNFWDTSAMSAAYQKMTMACKNVKNEIYTDIEIQNEDILPRLVYKWKIVMFNYYSVQLFQIIYIRDNWMLLLSKICNVK